MIQIGRLLLGVTVLCGCAAGTQSSTIAKGAEPDCSFRSPATCWTMSGRFPPQRHTRREAQPDRVSTQPSAILASGADSTVLP
jgi:hypothetical protein